MADPEGLRKWTDLLNQLRETQRLRDGASGAITERDAGWIAGKTDAASAEQRRQLEMLKVLEARLVEQIDAFVRSKLG